jgi:hypothetical protein
VPTTYYVGDFAVVPLVQAVSEERRKFLDKPEVVSCWPPVSTPRLLKEARKSLADLSDEEMVLRHEVIYSIERLSRWS